MGIGERPEEPRGATGVSRRVLHIRVRHGRVLHAHDDKLGGSVRSAGGAGAGEHVACEVDAALQVRTASQARARGGSRTAGCRRSRHARRHVDGAGCRVVVQVGSVRRGLVCGERHEDGRLGGVADDGDARGLRTSFVFCHESPDGAVQGRYHVVGIGAFRIDHAAEHAVHAHDEHDIMPASVLLVDGCGLRDGGDAHEKVVLGVVEGPVGDARRRSRFLAGVYRGIDPDAARVRRAVGAIVLAAEEIGPGGGAIGVGDLVDARDRGIAPVRRAVRGCGGDRLLARGSGQRQRGRAGDEEEGAQHEEGEDGALQAAGDTGHGTSILGGARCSGEFCRRSVACSMGTLRLPVPRLLIPPTAKRRDS